MRWVSLSLAPCLVILRSFSGPAPYGLTGCNWRPSALVRRAFTPALGVHYPSAALAASLDRGDNLQRPRPIIPDNLLCLGVFVPTIHITFNCGTKGHQVGFGCPRP